DNATLTGMFDGGADDDTLDFSRYTTARIVTLNALGSTDGFSGTATGISATFDNVETILGSSAATDTWNGLNADARWDVDGTNTYTAINAITFDNTNHTTRRTVATTTTALTTGDLSGLQVMNFVGFETLQGGSTNDVFVITDSQTENLKGGGDEDYVIFNDGATLTGSFNGEAGRDTLDYSNLQSPISVLLTSAGSVDGFNGTESSLTNGFSNVNEIIGNNAIDSLTGLSADSAWTINVFPTFGQYVSTNTLYFAKIDSLIGLGGADSFTFADNATLSGSVNGNGGNDTLSFAPYTSTRNFALMSLGGVDGFNGTVNGIASGFNNINAIVGGTAVDTLTGLNADSTWNISGTMSGNYVSTNLALSAAEGTLAFSQVDTLNGGSAVDLLIYSAFNTSVTVNLSTNTATGFTSVFGMNNITGGSANDSLTGDDANNVITGNGDSDTMTGLGGDDTYIFANGFGANDTIVEAASGGNDTLDFLSVTANLTFTLGSVTVTDGTNNATHTQSNVENLIGGSGNDSFV
ncbi:MAG: hypothetical protein AAB571_13755, partial [Chloroflexota bacterium]